MLKEELSISELARRAGVSIRTIRYYIKEGLLPSPQVRGRYSLYDEDYVYRLRLIKHLKDAYLPLKEIREQLEGLNSAEIRELLEKYNRDYQDLEVFTRSEKGNYQYQQKSDDTSSALEYISRVLDVHTGTSPQPRARRPYRPQKPDAQRGRQPTHSPRSIPSQEKIRSQLQGGESSWQRIQLVPGVELHVRQPLPARYADLIQELIDFVQNYKSKSNRRI